MASYSDCHGCSLCLLSCPMWLQKRDVRFSPQGIAKALQFGANKSDLSEQVSTCISCGACDVICPEKIDLTGLIESLLDDSNLEFNDDAYPISCNPKVKQNLKADDLYIIDAQYFHAHHAQRVEHYDVLRHVSGCSINLDLNRMAIPTGMGSFAESEQRFDVKKQTKHLIQGREFSRIIVENAKEKEILQTLTGKTVIHVSDLIKEVEPHA
ncbi:MAG: 4Fe-4S dicluster domain-containing protein [Mariprofundaceae bacterium]